MRIDRDDAVERVLRALGRAEAPGGLEARIAREVERQQRLAGPTMAGVWWRGAVSGAAAALFLVGIVMVGRHFVLRQAQVPPERSLIAGRVSPAGAAVGLVRSGGGRVPCADAGGSRVLGASVEGRDGERLEIAEAQPRQPPLTALTEEERNLVRVVRVADVKELAMLNPEVRARIEAEDAAQFQSFFAEPVYKPEKPAAAEPLEAVPGMAEPAAGPATGEPDATQPSTEPATGGNQ